MFLEYVDANTVKINGAQYTPNSLEHKLRFTEVHARRNLIATVWAWVYQYKTLNEDDREFISQQTELKCKPHKIAI